MRDQLAKMNLRQISLWLMVMLDPAYKALYVDRWRIPTENEYPKSVQCLLDRSIIIFQKLLTADCTDGAEFQEDIVAVLNAAHHITAIPSGQAWVGRAVYPVILGIELIFDEYRSPSSKRGIHENRFQLGLRQLEDGEPEIAQKERTEAYYHRLNALGTTLTELETMTDDKPFGKPIPPELVKHTLQGTYFDEAWRMNK